MTLGLFSPVGNALFEDEGLFGGEIFHTGENTKGRVKWKAH